MDDVPSQVALPLGPEPIWKTEDTAEVYRPSLRVDVSAVAPDDTEMSNGTTPKAAITPHVSTNIFVAGIPPSWNESDLCQRFQEFGEIISTRIVRRRHFGFVMFRKPEYAHAAINAVHLTHPIPGSQVILHVSIAMHDEGVDGIPNDRIFIRGLPQWATKEHVKQCFMTFGTILDCAVLMNPQGQCKGSGFVQFSSVEEATAAINMGKCVRIENWEAELEVKYSETDEVRQQRQERNKFRQKHSPNYMHHLPSLPLYSPPVQVMPSIPAFPLMTMAPQPTFAMFYPQPPVSPVASPHVLCSPMVTSSALSVFHSPPPVYESRRNKFPSTGDLHFLGVSLTEATLMLLLQRYGSVEEKLIFDETGAAARMTDRSVHTLIAQQLNGAIFSSGQVVTVGLYA